jgi:outer membrane lipoprotein-sorting protein
MNVHEPDFPAGEPTDDPLELAVRAMKQEAVPAGPSAETIVATLKSLEARDLSSKATILSIPRSRFMKIAKTGSGLLLTSCIVLAVVALREPASAYAQVSENARKAKSMSYLETITSPGSGSTAVVRKYVTVDGRSRTEHMFNGRPSGTVTIMEPSGHIRVSLIDFSAMAPPGLAGLPAMNRKTATLYPPGEDRRPVEGGHANSWLRSLQSLEQTPDKELGQKYLDGKNTRGFEATLGKMKVVMWIDIDNGRPVQIDYDNLDYHVTMTEFKFDTQLDESLFSYEAPEGYEARQGPATPKAVGGEAGLIIALRSFTTQSGGAFPGSITDWSEWVTLPFKKPAEGKPELDAKAKEELTRDMSSIGAVLPFLNGMDKSDYAYRGKGKTTSDKDAIVFWYKKADGTYRAIYGDLSVKEIAAQDVPKD